MDAKHRAALNVIDRMHVNKVQLQKNMALTESRDASFLNIPVKVVEKFPALKSVTNDQITRNFYVQNGFYYSNANRDPSHKNRGDFATCYQCGKAGPILADGVAGLQQLVQHHNTKLSPTCPQTKQRPVMPHTPSGLYMPGSQAEQSQQHSQTSPVRTSSSYHYNPVYQDFPSNQSGGFY